MNYPRQCAVLVGGLGTRLGHLTAATPKPLLPCGGRPFLAWICRELVRFGFEELVLLAGYKSEIVEDFARSLSSQLPRQVSVRISVEPAPAGTGGAVWHARNMLDETFLLINGDSWFDTNLARFLADFNRREHLPSGSVLLRSMMDSSRYGNVHFENGNIIAFEEKSSKSAGLISTGIYIFTRRVFEFLQPQCSLERDVMPVLAQQGLLAGCLLEGYFVDIGIPHDYSRAQTDLPARLLRPAVFFDRDGVLNEDLGWVGTRERFHWIPGALDALRLAVDRGYHVFVVTNQAGVAKGLYGESDVIALHEEIVAEARGYGANIDDIRYCPFHPDGIVEQYRRASDWRKPDAGMITDLLQRWDVNRGASILIGDKESDLQAARAAGIRSALYEGGDLSTLVESRLDPAPARFRQDA